MPALREDLYDNQLRVFVRQSYSRATRGHEAKRGDRAAGTLATGSHYVEELGMSTGNVESVWSVRYGERVVHKGDVFHDYAQYGLPDGDLHMDYNFWVIRAGDAVVLMDTGYDIAARTGWARSA